MVCVREALVVAVQLRQVGVAPGLHVLAGVAGVRAGRTGLSGEGILTRAKVVYE